MQELAGEVGGVTVSELRGGVLLLSQPGEADWHFWADGRDPERASELATTWAAIFVEHIKSAATASMILQSYHATIESGCGTDCDQLESQIADLEVSALGISPFVEVGSTQAKNLPITRKIAISTYILVGAVAALALGILAILFTGPRRNKQIGQSPVANRKS
jgi:hypothetical protein